MSLNTSLDGVCFNGLHDSEKWRIYLKPIFCDTHAHTHARTHARTRAHTHTHTHTRVTQSHMVKTRPIPNFLHLRMVLYWCNFSFIVQLKNMVLNNLLDGWVYGMLIKTLFWNLFKKMCYNFLI